jgi:hypothetical protein
MPGPDDMLLAACVEFDRPSKWALASPALTLWARMTDSDLVENAESGDYWEASIAAAILRDLTPEPGLDGRLSTLNV